MKKHVLLAFVAASALIGRATVMPVDVSTDYVSDGYYRYAPTTVVEDGVRHVFYCRNVDANVVVDGVYHAVQAADGALSGETLVLEPADSTGSAWDSYHVCDPSVVAGAFVYGGRTYKYLMAYLGVKGMSGDGSCDGAKCVNNKVGLAVSDSLTSGWVRMGEDPVVESEHADWWGVGQPSLVSLNGAGKVALFYAGDYGTRMLTLDFTDDTKTTASLTTKTGDAGTAVSCEGVTDLALTTKKMTITNGDFAYDAARHYLYLIADTPDSAASWYDDGGQHLSITKAVSVYRTRIASPATMNLSAATWEQVASFRPSDLTTGLSTAARIHNSGFVRDSAGALIGQDANISVANVKANALYTYRFQPVRWTEASEDGYLEFMAIYPLNLRHYMGPGTKIAVDFALTDTLQQQQRIIGIKWHHGIYVNSSLGLTFQSCEGLTTTGDKKNSLVSAVDTARHVGIIDVPAKKHVYLTEGVTNSVMSFTNPTSATTDHPIFLCGASNSANGETYVVPANKAQRYNAKAKIYGVKIWEDGALVHDYQPQVQDGLPGLKDLVDGAFLPVGQLATSPVPNAIPGGNIVKSAGAGYLQTDGRQGITTDYLLTTKSRLVLDYAYVNAAANQRIVSGGNASVGKGLYLDWYNNPGQHIVFVHDGAGDWTKTRALGYNTLSAAPATNLYVRRSYSMDIAAGKYFVATAGYTNETQDMKTPLPTSDATSVLKIFHGNATQMSKVRFYGAKIYEDGVLTRDYVPCVTNGVPCLYETKVGKFFYNDQGTNSIPFVAGGNIASFGAGSNDAYLQSDGTQAINVGYYSKPSTKFEIDFALDKITGQDRIFGVDGSAAKALDLLYLSGDAKYAFLCNTSWTDQKSSGIVADTLRHTATIDRENNLFALTRMNASDWSYTFTTGHDNTSLWPTDLFGGCNSADGTKLNMARLASMKLFAFRIYESGTLVHEFLPYKDGDTVGLYDTKTGDVKTNILANASAFVVGGRGANGNEDLVVVRPEDADVARDASVPLTVYAPGAIRYRWTLNGEELSETGGTASIPWVRHCKVSAVTVTPVYSVFGSETLGTPIPVSVRNEQMGLTVILR